MISRVTASGSWMCGVLAFVLIFHWFGASDCGSWRFSYISLPSLTETLFFFSIDLFFLLFPFLLRTCIILYIIRLESMKLQNQKKNLLRIQKNGHKNKYKKRWMKLNGTTFQWCACVNTIYFAPVVTTTYRMKNKKSSTRGLNLEMSVLARAQLLNVLYNSTHLSVPHGENI